MHHGCDAFQQGLAVSIQQRLFPDTSELQSSYLIMGAFGSHPLRSTAAR